MNDQTDYTRAAYMLMVALAGSVTALSMMNWKAMAWSEIFMTLFVGSVFAIFAVPYLAHDLFGVQSQGLRAVCFFTYIGATGANVFIPIIIRWFRGRLEKLLGLEEAA